MIDMTSLLWTIVIVALLYYIGIPSLWLILLVAILISSCLAGAGQTTMPSLPGLPTNAPSTIGSIYPSVGPLMYSNDLSLTGRGMGPSIVRPDGYYGGNTEVIEAMQEGHNGSKYAYGYYDGTNYVI